VHAASIVGLHPEGHDASRCAAWQGASAPKHFWEVWQLFNLGDPKGTLWSALPRQLPTVLALAFVVAFGGHLHHMQGPVSH
jgi:hypothetical protein